MALINNLRLVLIKNLPIKKILNQAKNCESPSVNLLKEQKKPLYEYGLIKVI